MISISFETRVARVISGASALFFLLAILLVNPKPARGIPAFARKYGLPCSACHVTWPELNNFGQVFRDNGYQMMNERDSPITHDASYFPITVRITPQWHMERANEQLVDSVPGDGTSAALNNSVTTSGFDLSGMDLWFAGTLFKNVTFSVLPSSDENASFHFENAFVRFDNLAGSRWLNVKVGKFELDEPVSEKRLWTLSGNGGFYYIYHFLPYGDANPWGGMGDNQLGVEIAGHSVNSYTRYAFSVLSSNDGQPGFIYGGTSNPTGRTYDYYGHFEQGWNTPGLGGGFLKVGGYVYYGFAPTYYQTSGGAPLYGIGNEPFYRAGAEVKYYANKWIFKGVYMHAYDNAYLANGIPSNSGPLPAGAQAVIWNGGFAEGQYIISPQWVIMFRYEGIRMSQQANTAINSNQSNMDAFTIASRWNPFMFSRAGLAIQQEYSVVRSNGVTSLGGVLTPSACPATSNTCNVLSQSLFFGFDFDF